MSKDVQLGTALVKRMCRVCHATEDAEIVMNTRLTKPEKEKVENMHGQVIGWIEGLGMCKDCAKHAKRGVYLITVDSSKTTDMDNPYRTGKIFCVKNAAIKKIFKDPKELLERRIGYIDDELAVQIGLTPENASE